VKRISLVGVALVASSLAIAVTVVPAGAKTSKGKTKTVKAKPVKVEATCTSDVSIAVLPGQTQVVPPVNQGHEYGLVSCGTLGKGVQSESLTLQDTGNYVGTYTEYFDTGTIHGTYTLIPGDSIPTGPTTFNAANYTGTATVVGGTGAYRKAIGTGTLTCSTPDSIHSSCSEKLKLTLPPVTKKA
jgi:hypothetical protein